MHFHSIVFAVDAHCNDYYWHECRLESS